MAALTIDGIGRCEALNSDELTWHKVNDFLRLQYPGVYSQFSALSEYEQDLSELRLARKAGGFAFKHWSEGGDIDNLRQLPYEFATYLDVDPAVLDRMGSPAIERLLRKLAIHTELRAERAAVDNVWSLPKSARTELREKWKAALDPKILVEQLAEIHRRHQIAISDRNTVGDNIDQRCLENRRLKISKGALSEATNLRTEQIIGVTTTACAKYWPLLRSLKMRTLICEEAGEVMEAHTLCTLFPSIEHAIFIGDPLQLR